MSRTPTRKTLTPVSASLMQSAMQTLPHSLDELVTVSTLSKPTVTRYVRELACAGLVHVGSWARDPRGYPTIRQYAWGNKVDAPCPKTTRTAADRMRILRTARKVEAA